MPKRVEIPWQRMLYILKQIRPEETSSISTEEQLNDFFGNGRRSFSCSLETLFLAEIVELYIFEEMESSPEFCLVCQKETYPGKYMVGEF